MNEKEKWEKWHKCHLGFMRKEFRKSGDKKQEEEMDARYKLFIDSAETLNKGKRLTAQEKAELLVKARAVIYGK